MNNKDNDLVHIVRLATQEQIEDVRLYTARMVRQYRKAEPDLSKQLNDCLQMSQNKDRRVFRKTMEPDAAYPLPLDDDSRLSLLKEYNHPTSENSPLLHPDLVKTLQQLKAERLRTNELLSKGLQPTRSAIFVGPPGVGKTLTARWLAGQLEIPFYVLDLSAVMSSFLGRSGGNLRAALDFAKRQPCVVLLDEIDAIAKKRSDESDIGELKRLVTVILQEVDQWPTTSLLLAATNHPELIDPALWRRFDLIVKFPQPNKTAVAASIRRFLDEDYETFKKWDILLVDLFEGYSFSDIERELQRFRRALVLETTTPKDLILDFIQSEAENLSSSGRIKWATLLSEQNLLSQRAISDLTNVSRDTIRKYRRKNESRKNSKACA